MNGDVVEFEFPPEIGLPSDDDLEILQIPRILGDEIVNDWLKIDKIASHKVSITFLRAGPAIDVYQWQIFNLRNPTSTQRSSPFTNLIVYASDRSSVQSY